MKHASFLVLCAFIAGLPAALADPEPAEQPFVRLHVFDCGALTFEDVAPFGLTGSDTDVRTMFVPCYLVRHPDGDLLWDAGLDPGIAGKGAIVSDGFTMVYERALLDQMEDMGLTPGDVEFIALSHSHFDHVGAAKLFPDAELLIQQAEYDAAFLNHEAFGFLFDYELYGALANNPRQTLNGDHDVFGDGSVVIVSAPGHTPGHQVLLIRLKNTGPVLLSGDLFHFRATCRLRAVPEFNTDAAETLASMNKVERLLAETGAALWIEHDMALAQTLKLAPAGYD